MAKKNDESRESMVSPLLVDKVKVRDFDISSGISSKLEFSKLETVRDLRLRTPKEIRLQTCLPLFDYLELYKYLHSIGIYSYQETDQPPVNNVLSTGIAEGILLREIGLSELTINDLINKANYNESRYKLLTEQEIKRGFDDYSFLNEDRTLLQRNPVEYRRIKTKVSRFTKYIGDNLPFYRDSDYNSDFSRMGRDTYEELLLRMRESGLFSIKDDAYFEKCGEETIGCSFKSVKLTLCHRFSLYDSHFDNKSFAIFNSLGGPFSN